MHIETLRALADPVRLHIVDVLRSGEQSVNDIVDTLDIDQSGVSRHLRILHESGFVDMRPDGQRRMYSLRPEPFRELDAWISGYRSLWTARLDRFGDALSRRQTTRVSRGKERKTR
jgi:DNA-binding transcriptional ArsR family regulator